MVITEQVLVARIKRATFMGAIFVLFILQDAVSMRAFGGIKGYVDIWEEYFRIGKSAVRLFGAVHCKAS